MKRSRRLSLTFAVARNALLALLACAAAPTLPAQAGAYTFSNPSAQRTINAGIVLLDSTNSGGTTAGPDNPDPYPFYILSRRVDLLPVGWTIKNPLASHNVSADVQTRWDARANNSLTGQAFATNNGGHAYQFGQNVTPGMAAYWEVSLDDTSTQDLKQFDVLLVNLANNDVARFRPSEVEKLRRFVDDGGTLLVEDSGGGSLAANTAATYGPLFFPLQYAANAAGPATLPTLAYRHPIISAPYYLAQSELNALGNGFTGDVIDPAATSSEFTAVVDDKNGKAVIAADTYGAGAVVVSSTGSVAAINNAVTAGSINAGYGPNSGPYCGTNFQAAPTRDLKFLCDIISWVGGHSHEHQNSHQTGETLSSLPSVVRSWNYLQRNAAGALAPGGSNVPGAAISGNFVYSMDAAGALRAFDLYPSEDLDGDKNPDDGIPDYNTGTAYDQVWSVSTGQGSSAPTIANPGGVSSIFVEGLNGTVYQYPASSTTVPTATSLAPSTAPGVFGAGPAPAPTYYEGRMYASEPDGSLFVYDFTAGSGKSVPLAAPTIGGAAIPTGAPLVGAIASTGPDRGTTPQATDIVAMVPTTYGLYSLFLGARGEQLTGANTTFIANHVPATAMIDATPTLLLQVYSLPTATPPANGYAHQEAYTVSGRTFTVAAPTALPLFANYDVSFGAAGTSLTRTTVTFGSGAAQNGACSTPALDRFGNACYFASEPGLPAGPAAYTVLTSFHDATSGPRINWRFRLPAAGETVTPDADGTDYTPLEGFVFQGKPVVDSRGFVYALASNATATAAATQTALLCFNGLGTVTTAPLGSDVGSASLSQTLPNSADSEFGAGTGSSPILSSQYTQDGTGGPLTFNNFGATTSTSPAVLAPNMNEPEPISVSIAQSPNNAGGVYQVPLHTNLVWYSVLPSVGVTSGEGLTKVGNALFFIGGATANGPTNLYSVPADPQAAGFTIAGKVVDPTMALPTGATFVTNGGDTGVGPTSAIASAANGALIVNGANGVSAFLNRTTLVTDSSRVMELNQDGSAAWLVDSTQGSVGLGTTSLELSRPSSVFQITPNDYLVADTGNNRAVRFDRAGKVIWELSRFSDTYTDAFTPTAYGKTGPLLSANEPNTLNQPTSVQVNPTVETVAGSQYTVVHYLVSDTGNFRVLDIVDVYDANGNPVGTPHNLVWISHTHDKQQRQYRYQSAAYFTSPNNGARYVAALVTNKRVAQPPINPAVGVLGSAAQDAPGGSLVLLDYLPTATGLSATQKNGYIATVIDHVQAYISTNKTFNLAAALSNAGAATNAGAAMPVFTGGTPIRLYIRNPRCLKVYTPAGAGANTYPNLLLADDNGVFDLIYDAGSTTAPARDAQYFTQWGFTQADYQSLHINSTLNPLPGPDRAAIPFVPQSIQRTATDTVVSGGNTYAIGHYLVTNGYSKGNPGNLTNAIKKGDPGNLTDIVDFGGEVFDLDVVPTAAGGLATDITNTLDRIGNSGPLVQPTFAFRLQ